MTSVEHKDRAHARLSPSAGDQWTNCTMSPSLSAGLERKSSKWADEGTRAHELAEAYLRSSAFDTGSFQDPDGNAERQDAIDVYADVVGGLRFHPQFVREGLEVRVNLNGLWPDGAPEEVFGTSDYYALVGDTLYIVDFKYGAYYAVSAKENTQLRLYAVMVWLSLSLPQRRSVRYVVTTIVQPRAKHPDGLVRSEALDLADLLRWVYDGPFKAVEDIAAGENLALREGAWCKWCPAASATCPAKRQTKQDEARKLFDEEDDRA